MAQVFFDPSSLSTLSNTDLVKKYQNLEEQASKLKSSFVSEEIYNDIISLLGYYETEIDNRLNNGTMCEDELDDIV